MNLMDFTEKIEGILANILRKDYTTSKVECQELLHEAFDERKEYEDYLDEMSVVYDNMKLMERGLS